MCSGRVPSPSRDSAFPASLLVTIVNSALSAINTTPTHGATETGVAESRDESRDFIEAEADADCEVREEEMERVAWWPGPRGARAAPAPSLPPWLLLAVPPLRLPLPWLRNPALLVAVRPLAAVLVRERVPSPYVRVGAGELAAAPRAFRRRHRRCCRCSQRCSRCSAPPWTPSAHVAPCVSSCAGRSAAGASTPRSREAQSSPPRHPPSSFDVK